MSNTKPVGDVKIKKLGKQLLINIPREVAEYLSLRAGPMKITTVTSGKLVLVKGEGSAKILEVGKGKLRLYIGEDKAPFKEGERVLVTVQNDKLVVKRIDYYVVKPTIRRGQYRVNTPLELAEKTGLDKYQLVKIYSDRKRIVLEPFTETY